MTERAAESPLRVLSYGGGTQSSGLALMSLTGELERLDAIVFADTRHEMPATYSYVELISNLADEAGVPFVWASAGDLKQTLVDRRGRGMQPNLPVRVRDPRGQLQRVNAYRCSYDFKRRVIAQAVKKLCGRSGAWKRTDVEQWIGFSVDEVSRVRREDECRCGHKRFRPAGRGRDAEFIHDRDGCRRCDCTGFDPWQCNRWPLIERQMTRTSTLRWIVEHGYPEPPRSALLLLPEPRQRALARPPRESPGAVGISG